jgi:pilus assembly protein Flp/PilA
MERSRRLPLHVASTPLDSKGPLEMNLRHMIRREDGQTMTEYGVLLALIAVVVIAALLVLGPQIKNIFDYVGSQLG